VRPLAAYLRSLDPRLPCDVQFGDQVMLRGNRAIRDHAVNGKHLRLFQGARGEVTYLGEFEYVTHHIEKAPASRLRRRPFSMTPSATLR
jgi:hypothetical protein